MVKAVLVGNGAREHAIAEALVRGGAELKAFMKARNPGIARLAEGRVKITSLENFEALIEFARDADFVVVGPEAPLVVGIANALASADIPCVGPTIEAARLEGSKIFTRNLLEKYGITSNVKFKRFDGMEGVEEWIDELGEENVVVKPDGLTGGKGVKVYGDHLHSRSDILEYCKQLKHFVIEEKLDGEEFTLQTFVDGKHIVPTPIVQDHKRAYEGDKGPNTGGMGSYSMEDHLMPFISKQDVETALNDMRKTIEALKKESGVEYKGFLYGQFMKTADGIKLVEYNVRFGDPEAMNILPIMKTNFVDICFGILDGNLPSEAEFEKVATVCRYMVPEGYPVNPAAGKPITVDEEGLKSEGIKFYYASVNEENGVIYTSRSRTLAILGIGSNIKEAYEQSMKGVNYVKGPLFYRKDIGTEELLAKRIEHMKRLTGGN